MGRPASGKWRAEPRSEPDSGHPTVRDRRGALGDVTHGEPRNPTRKSKERLWSLLAYRCARPGSIPTTRMSGSVGGWGQQRPWSTRPSSVATSSSCVATTTSSARTERYGSGLVYRAQAHGHLLEFERAIELLEDASARYPDSRPVSITLSQMRRRASGAFDWSCDGGSP